MAQNDIGKVVIGKAWHDGSLIPVYDIIKSVTEFFIVTEKGFLILKENVKEIREGK